MFQTRLKHLWLSTQDWVIVAVFGFFMIRECIAVSTHLGSFHPLLGLLSGVLFSSIIGYIFGRLKKRLSRWQKTALLFLVVSLSSWLIGNAGAANSQFLQNAEDFFTTGADTFGLGENITLLVQLIFWIIRGAFVIGVAIALLPAIQAAREGDEWRSLAKTPMLVTGIFLAGATSVDILVGGAGDGG